MKLIHLRECGCAEIRAPADDEPIVRDCKLLGYDSKNGRRYLPEAVARAVSLYEGASCFIDHPDSRRPEEPRPFLSRFGTFRNVRSAGDGLRGDLHYNPSHIYAGTFKGWLDTDPKGAGFSHNATGKVREEKDGSVTVIEIVEVHSVDLVAVPATTRGLFEAMDPSNPLMSGDAPAEEVGDSHWSDDLASMVGKIFGDADMSPEEKRKKILHLLKLDDVGTDDPDEPNPEDDLEEEEEPSDEDTEEALRRRPDPASRKAVKLIAEAREQKRRAERRKAGVKACKEHHVPEHAVTEAFLDVLESLPDDAAVNRQVRDRLAVLNPTRQARSVPAGSPSPTLNMETFLKTLNEN